MVLRAPCPSGGQRLDGGRRLQPAAASGINRREFLGAGAAFAVLVGLPWKAAGTASPPAVEGVAEVSHGEGRAFAAACGDRGLATRETGADPSVLVQEIAVALAQRPVALVGLTTTATALLVEAVARDHGLVLTYRGRHERAAGGVLRHSLAGDRETVRCLASRLSSSASAWPQAFSQDLARLLVPPSVPTQIAIEFPAVPPSGTPGPLVSWALVPWREA